MCSENALLTRTPCGVHAITLTVYTACAEHGHREERTKRYPILGLNITLDPLTSIGQAVGKKSSQQASATACTGPNEHAGCIAVSQ